MIRTLDPLLPKQVRYQAALYSVRVAAKLRERLRYGTDATKARPMAGYIAGGSAGFKPQPPSAGFRGVELRALPEACRNPPDWGVAKW